MPEPDATSGRKGPSVERARMDRAERIERRFEVPIVIGALLVIPILIAEQTSPGEPWATLADVGNWLIWLLFLAEVVVMLAVVPDRGRWLRAHPLEVAIVVLTPPFLPASLQALRVFRLLRLLRLIAVVGYARRLFSLDGLRYAALLAVLAALGGGAAFSAVEGKDVSTWDGVWWAVTTMTTVGYGDLSPATDLGRVIAIAVMLVGIGFLTLLIGAVSERFVAHELVEESRRRNRSSRKTSTPSGPSSSPSSAPSVSDSASSRPESAKRERADLLRACLREKAREHSAQGSPESLGGGALCVYLHASAQSQLCGSSAATWTTARQAAPRRRAAGRKRRGIEQGQPASSSSRRPPGSASSVREKPGQARELGRTLRRHTGRLIRLALLVADG